MEPYFQYFVVPKILSWSNQWAVFSMLLFKMVSILFFDPTGTSEASNYESGRANLWIVDEMQVTLLPTNWLLAFFKWMHISFTGPILQYSQRKLMTWEAKYCSLIKKCHLSLWLEYDPMYQTWTHNLLITAVLLLHTLGLIL